MTVTGMRYVSFILLLSLTACSKRDEAPEQRTAAAAQPLASTAPSEPAPSASVATTGPLPQSAQECAKTCNGEWGRHGIKRQVYCLCRTTDAGKECEDGADCQGQCLMREIRTRVVENGPPARGYFIGACAEFVTTLGCVRRVERGAKQRGPVDLGDPPPPLCAD
jgi:hypothetical protein